MLQTFFFAAYTLIALFFLDATHREGEVQGGQWDVMRVLGMLACLVWPLLLLHVAFLAYRRRQAN